MVAWSLSSTFIPAKPLPCYFTNLFIESGEPKVNLLVIVFYLCSILFKIYLFLAELDLRCFAQAFSSWGEQWLLLVVVHWTSCCGGFSCWGAQALGEQASGAVVLGSSCSTACKIFPDLGSNPCPCFGRWILNHWTTREIPKDSFFFPQGHYFFNGNKMIFPRSHSWCVKLLTLGLVSEFWVQGSLSLLYTGKECTHYFRSGT